MKLVKKTIMSVLMIGFIFMTGVVQARQYVVKQNDNLRDIAERELGDASRWREIAMLNSLEIQRSECGEYVVLSVNQILDLPETLEERLAREKVECQRQELERILAMKTMAERKRRLAEEKCLQMRLNRENADVNVEDVESKKTALTEKIAQMESRVEESRQRISESEKELQLMRERVVELQNKRSEQSRSVEQLRKSIQDVGDEIRSHSMRLAQLQEERCACSADEMVLHEKIDALTERRLRAEMAFHFAEEAKLVVAKQYESLVRKKADLEKEAFDRKMCEKRILELQIRKNALHKMMKVVEQRLQEDKLKIIEKRMGFLNLGVDDQKQAEIDGDAEDK